MPPKPNKSEAIIILIEICLQGMVLIFWTPFVSSITPEKKLLTNCELVIPNSLKNGSKIEDIAQIKLLFSRIESTTLKSTTNPPIISIVLVAEDILEAKTSPKLEKDTVEEFVEIELISVFLLSYLANLFFVREPFARVPAINDTIVLFTSFPKSK